MGTNPFPCEEEVLEIRLLPVLNGEGGSVVGGEVGIFLGGRGGGAVRKQWGIVSVPGPPQYPPAVLPSWVSGLKSFCAITCTGLLFILCFW